MMIVAAMFTASDKNKKSRLVTERRNVEMHVYVHAMVLIS